jgi:hypothetical protein
MKDIATDIAIALITGFVASFFYEKFVAWRRYRELKAGFEWLHGRYDEHAREGSKLVATRWTITLTYRGQLPKPFKFIPACGTKFATEAKDSDGKREWYGELVMREDAAVVGEGFYVYDSKDDVGVHRVIYNPKLS